MTDYERADQERATLYERKSQVREQLKSITDPVERAAQKKRLSILEAMYKEALDRMEAARPPDEKKRKAPKQRVVHYVSAGSDGVTYNWLERNRYTFSDIEGNTVRWEDLGVEESGQKARYLRAIKRGRAACSPRQMEMLDLMLQGKNCREIAETLGVDRSTVVVTLQRAKRKIRTMEEAMTRLEKTAGVIDVSRREVAEHLLSCLTETQAVYLYLYYGEWLSMPDIAKLLDRDKSTVCKTLHLACRRIRGAYDCADGGTLLGMDALEPMLYEIYQSHAADDLIPARAKEAAKRITHRDEERIEAHREGCRSDIFASALWVQRRTLPEAGSRLLRALKERAAQRAGSMLDWLCALLRYAHNKVLKSMGTYYEWQRQH